MSEREELLKLRRVVEGAATSLIQEAKVLDYTAKRMVGAPSTCADVANSLNYHAKILMEAIRDPQPANGE